MPPLLRNLEGKFVPRDRLHPALQDAIFSLQLNEVSEPLRFGNTGVLVKVSAERSVPFADYADSEGLHSLFREWKFPREREQHLQELAQKYRPMAATDGLQRFFQEAEAAGWDGIRREVVLYEYDGGTITAGRLLDQLSIDQLSRHGEEARLHAKVVPGNEINVAVENISRYTLALNDNLVNMDEPVVITTNGSESYAGPAQDAVTIGAVDGIWSAVAAEAAHLEKHAMMAGPIFEAFNSQAAD